MHKGLRRQRRDPLTDKFSGFVMQIRRDYSQPFFSDRRRRRGRGSWFFILFMVALIVGGLFFIDSQFPQLQVAALHMVGQGPAPTPFASFYAEQGYTQFLAGDVVAAARSYGQAVAQQPTNVDYLYEYGRSLIESEQYEAAIPVGDQAINANPRDPRGYAIKARAMDLSGDSAGAIPVGQQGLQIDPNYAPLHAALSSAYRNIDRYDVALDFAEKAVELDPLDATAHRVYAFALIWVGRREEAITQLEQAISINPNLTAPYFELAGQYRGENRFEEVVATYETVLTINPGNAKANLRLCQVYIQIGQDNRAQGYCEDALANDPNYAEAQSTMGWVMYRRRNYEGANEMFQQCANNIVAQSAGVPSESLVRLQDGRSVRADSINEDTIRCWYMRGLSHYYLGECDASWTLLQESLPLTTYLPSYAATTIGGQIRDGLSGVTARCTGYVGRGIPTEIPPTPVPPTPIGG